MAYICEILTVEHVIMVLIVNIDLVKYPKFTKSDGINDKQQRVDVSGLYHDHMVVYVHTPL